MIININAEKNKNEYLSKNFKVAEFQCKDNSPILDIDTQLLTALEFLREKYKEPIYILSAYRTRAYNIKIGGAINSFHSKGQAIDFYFKIHDMREVYNYIRETIEKDGDYYNVKGLIFYSTKNFIHIDTRLTKYINEVK